MPRRSNATADTRLTGTQSIERALTLLREIAAHNRSGSRLLDLATRTGLQRPTVHRMLKCLAAESMVQQDTDSHRYFLGPMVFELGLTAAPRFNLREICHPSLSRLAEATGDTVFLTQRSGLDSVCLDRREGTFPIKTFTLEIGMRRPLGVGTGSLAILSALQDDEIQAIIAANTARLPEYGLNPGTLQSQVKRSQKLGFAMRDLPGLSGVRSVGQALRNQSGVAFAALSVSTISSRMSDKRAIEVAQLLKNESRQLERQLLTGADGR
ncbi:MAG: IclR family transcriptional regulator [Betaproteobacteria bacterium]|nr:IclR family transcriptional regulator [Betaproteobacteria bacterium]MDH3437369.1 IclR family transcriptional regulator [Betaproteobacteria bacterium]